MKNSVEHLFRVIDSQGETHGVAFLVSPRVALTCAHVIIACKADIGKIVRLCQADAGEVYDGCIDLLNLEQDIATITLQKPLKRLSFSVFGPSENSQGTKFDSFGYPDPRGPGVYSQGIIGEKVPETNLIQLNNTTVSGGFSGAPIWEKQSGRVLGMVTAFFEPIENLKYIAYAIPSGTIRENLPDLIYDDSETTDLQSCLQGYTSEVINDYTSYWQNFVKQTPEEPYGSSSHRPVSQTFVLSEKKSQIFSSWSDSSYQIQELTSDISSPQTNTQSVFPSLLSAYNALVLEQHKRFAVLEAEPGAGKTFSLRFLAAELAKQFTSIPSTLPIYIPLNLYADQDDLFVFIREYLFAQGNKLGYRRLAAYLDEVISTSEVLFLFDGLNEIESPLVQQKVLESIYALSNNSNNICLVSTRAVSQNLPSLTHILSIRPLDRDGAIECIQLYAPQHLNEIIRLLQDSPKIRLLASNPFRLKIMCGLFKKDSHLPETPGRLLEEYVEALENRFLNDNSHSRQFLKGIQGYQIMLSGLASKNTPVIRLDGSILSTEERDCLLYAEAIGVIQFVNDQVIFIHQQLQEYFAAIWLKTVIEQNNNFNTIQGLLLHAEWDEPFYLLVGILDDRYIDLLIYQIAQIDPFLAARCIEIVSQRINPSLLDWFADYLRQGLEFAENEEDDVLFEKTLIALGDTGYKKCFEYLCQPDVWQPIEVRTPYNRGPTELYYQTIARFDTPAAAEFIIARLNQNLATSSENYWPRRDYEIYTLALARMQTPIARQFLSEHLQDIRIFRDVVKAVGIARLPEAEQMRDLLEGTGCINDSEARDYFLLVTQAVGQSGMTELIPILKLFKNREEAIEILLKLNAGQELIDDYVTQQERFLGLLESSKDFIPFCLRTEVYWYGIEVLRVWNFLNITFGKPATDVFTNLLLYCAENSTEKQEVLKAVMGLALLRIHHALPALRELVKRNPLFPKDEYLSDRDERNEFLTLEIQKVIEFLETPGARGIYQDNMESFMLFSRSFWQKFRGESLPQDPSTLLKKARTDRDFVRELALESLYSNAVNTFWIGEKYQDLAARFLIDSNQPNLVRALMHRLMTAYMQPYHSLNLKSAWRATEPLVSYALKGKTQRQEVMSQLVPLIYGTDVNLQIIAIETLADLAASELCPELFAFLSDTSWVTAYAVVGAIRRLKPDDAASELLLNRLYSHNPDERYFAALALGELNRSDFIPQLLKLENDPNLHVRRAMLCALARCGSREAEVVQVVTRAIQATNGWERLEAARVAGELALVELVPLLISRLQDCDLRVVEQVVIALGKLRANSSLPGLHLLFQSLNENTTGYWPFYTRARPEPVLREKIAISIAQFTNDGSYTGASFRWQLIAQNDGSRQVLSEIEGEQSKPERQVVKGLKNNNLLQSVIAGQMERGSLQPFGEGISNALKPQLPRIPTKVTAIQDTNQGELNHLRRNSPDPAVRLQAFKAYTQRMDSDSLRDDFSNLDPSPDVQFELRRLRMKGMTNGRERAFMGLPHYDLMLAESLKEEAPGLVNYISPDIFSNLIERKDATLLIAELFSQDYKVDGLVNILLQLVEAGYRTKQVMATLSSLLEYDRLDQITRVIRQADDHMGDSWWFDVIDPMIQRRAWQVVPELLIKTGLEHYKGVARSEAFGRLCRLGVYQAGELLSDITDNHHIDIVPIMMRVELAGQTHNLVPQYWYDRQVDTDSMESCNWYVIANLACEAETETPPREWLFSVAKYIGMSDRDKDWLGRGLRKWGKVGAIALFAEMTRIVPQQELEKLCWSLISASDQRHSYCKSSLADREAILKTFSTSTDVEIIELLDSPEWAIRLLGTCLLVQRQSPLLELQVEKISLDSHTALLKTLLEYGLKGNLPGLQPILGGKQSLLKQAITNHLRNSDVATRKDLTSFLGDPGYHIFASELLPLLDDPDPTVAITAIETLRKMGAVEFTHQISRKRKTRRTDILLAALEAALVFNDLITPAEASKLLQNKDFRVVLATVTLCGFQGIQSVSSVLQDLQSRYEQEYAIAEAENKPLSFDTTTYRLRRTTETIRIALFMLGIEPSFSLDGQDYHLGEGLALQAVMTAIISSGKADKYLTSHGWPYPFVMDDKLQLALLAKLVKLDLKKASWAKPIMTQGTVELLSILERLKSTKEYIATFLDLPFGDEAIATWQKILADARSNLRQQIKDQLKVVDPSQSWIEGLIALRIAHQDGRQLKENPEEFAKTIICYAIASAIMEEAEINQIFTERLNQTNITHRQKNNLEYIFYSIGLETLSDSLGNIVELDEVQARNLAASDFMQTAQIVSRLCVTLSILNNFSSLTLDLLKAANRPTETNQNWLTQYQNEIGQRNWFGLFSPGPEQKQGNAESLGKINPFSRVLEWMEPIEGFLPPNQMS